MVEGSVTQSVCAAHLSQVVKRGEIWLLHLGAAMPHHIYYMSLHDWFTDWLADCFTDLLTNYMTDWLILGDKLNRFTGWLTDRAVTVDELRILDAGLNPIGEFLLKGINPPIAWGSDHRNSQCFRHDLSNCYLRPPAGCRQIKQICESDTYFFFC